jgi:UDP-N-acetylmuramate-alanine ligase
MILIIGKEKLAIEKAVSKILGINYSKSNVLISDNIKNLDISKEDFIIFNSDCEKLEIADVICKSMSYGFNGNADFLAGEINESQGGINFKISHQGNDIPFWIKGISKREDIYPFLAAVAVGELYGINLVQSSQTLI